jgi:23S rRNA pseudouridine1911/1915/1917 synthase
MESMKFLVTDDMRGMRLDQAATQLLEDYSRSRVSEWIKVGQVFVDDVCSTKPKLKLMGGETIVVTPIEIEEVINQPELIPLDIIYEDESLIVINKPSGLVVHPAPGHRSGTLQNALLYHEPELVNVPRAGIIHRLDKLTTGLLVVARTVQSHQSLVQQLQAREFAREYEAVVTGVMTAGGCVDAPIGRHPVDRKKMSVNDKGKVAITHYRVERRYRLHTHVKVRLETGRTHQIRVHMAHINYPILGDSVYAGRQRIPAKAAPQVRDFLAKFPRQALHAKSLGLQHPDRDEWMQWQAETPDDIKELLTMLAQDEVDHE